ncbi:RNA-binding protein 6 isoform X1 [Mastacembelus armatus]|uniref:RNA-binding protein 6 isoform X1 n=1 Tax=Mastacembelus armatus TaxID=205130 RepID=UPI000E46108C|nr:RNA-binding protein 6-like isoform X1 [Mastacembelus armatus]XP_026161817.1 RNA-binding protein 6-like isoform X1 [Mastacembelus armatus]
MWDGPGQGPRGGPPFRGDHRGEMFGGRDRPMPDYRSRDGMNMGLIGPMGPMGHMGPRPMDLPPMDMRRMDGPPMRGRDMDTHDMRGREPNRDFFRPGEEPDFNLRRHYEMTIRDKLMNSSGFLGPGRNSDIGGRGLPPRETNSRFMDMRESFHYDMPRFNTPNTDGRRGLPMDRMERNDGSRDMRDRPPMSISDTDRFDMDLTPRERRLMDTDRRGGPPFNPRGGFDSDMDFRNRPGPPADFRGRDRSPLRFGNSNVPSVDRIKSDIPSDVAGPQRPEFMGAGDTLRAKPFPDSGNSPLMDYRSGEEMTLAEEWKNRRKDKNSLLNINKGMEGVSEPRFPVDFGREPPPFQERDRPSEFPGKEAGFPHGEHFPAIDLPSLGHKGPHEHPLTERNPLNDPLVQENDKHWLGERDQKHSQNKPHRDERPPYHKDKTQPSHEIQEPNDCFKGMKDIPQEPTRGKMGPECDFQNSSTVQARDQDYRDIDYRTESGRAFDYKREELQAPEKLIKESKPITPTKFSESGCQDQDYRSASVEDKISNTISIIGIPKTATMEQILGAFAVRDGVPMQGMKIKNVVPGYSYDTAYVEFLNLEDAVHFMESNKGSLKVGTRTATMKFIQPDDHERGVHDSDHKDHESQLPRPNEPSEELKTNPNASKQKGPVASLSHGQWQRSSDLTPEAWQQQVDQQLQQQETEQQAEPWGNRNPPHHNSHHSDAVFKDSKTMIIKNVKPTTTVETILKALDPFAYLDERNVRLVKAKPPGTKCFCFVDMDSHEQVTRLVELLTKPRPLYIDGVRVYAEVAKPLKNQNFRREFDKQQTSLLGHPPEASMLSQLQQQYPQPPLYLQPLHPPAGAPIGMQGDLMTGPNPPLSTDPSISQGVGYSETPAVDPSFHAGGPHIPTESAGMAITADGSEAYIYGTENPDMSSYLYDATSGFYYDPETTLYYDPNSRYFYNAQTQEYLYWDAVSKTYIPVPGGNSVETQPVTMTAEDQAILSNPAADAPLEMKKPSVPPHMTVAQIPVATSSAQEVDTSTAAPEKKDDDDCAKKDKEKDKDEKPRSLAAVKIMKDMERWAKIQNRQKESVRAPSPVLKTGMDDDKRQSKSADAGFAVFERKISGGDDLFKKPLAPPKRDEKSKRPMGSLGLLASDYAAGSDEEVEEDKEEAAKSSQGSQSEDREDKLTDWKKMACLLCRRQFPNKDALIRHQQLSDLHKQNMEIHLKIKRSKKELEALENQEKELNAREAPRSPEQKRRKHHHQPPQHHNTWAGSSREISKVSERPGLGAEPVPQRKKKEPVVWDHATYKQAVRKAMFARFKELE